MFLDSDDDDDDDDDENACKENLPKEPESARLDLDMDETESSDENGRDDTSAGAAVDGSTDNGNGDDGDFQLVGLHPSKDGSTDNGNGNDGDFNLWDCILRKMRQ